VNVERTKKAVCHMFAVLLMFTSCVETIVRVDPKYFRPTEVEFLLGSPEKAKKMLGWVPKVTFEASFLMLSFSMCNVLIVAGYRDG